MTTVIDWWTAPSASAESETVVADGAAVAVGSGACSDGGAVGGRVGVAAGVEADVSVAAGVGGDDSVAGAGDPPVSPPHAAAMSEVTVMRAATRARSRGGVDSIRLPERVEVRS
jgi:hypothetical protein